MASQIRITIKAANGLVDDFVVDAQSNWTIHQLKNHLYRHYSTHPPQTSQKLIHGGRLLLDQQTLQEAVPDLLNADGVVIHLVAYERSASAPSGLSSSSSESYRQPVSRTPSRTPTSRQPSLTPVQENSRDDLAAQETTQRATVQQVQQPANVPAAPQQASHPWLRHRGGMVAPNAQMYQVPGMGMGQVQNFPMYMPMGGYPFPPQFYMSPYGAAYANQMAQWYNNYSRQPPSAGGDLSGEGNIEREEDIDLPIPQNVANNEDDVDNDVQAMNAGALGMMAGGGVNFQNHRDFVDYLYMFIMAAFLALIAYITGSFGRLLIFAGGIMFMLLNQAGWFALQRRPGRQPVEQNPLAQIRAEQQQQQQQQQQQVVQPQTEQEQRQPNDESGQQRSTQESDSSPQAPLPAEDSMNEPSHQQQEAAAVQAQNQQHPAAPPAEERPGLLATLFVFVTSFFTSLIPQQRPELQIN